MKNYFIKLIFVTLFFLIFFPSEARAASLNLSGKKEVSLNSQTLINVFVNTKGERVNTVEVKINFDPQNMEVISLNTNPSVFSIFVQKDFDNSKGEITFVAGVPSPGFSGNGNAFQIIFLPKKLGKTTVSVSSGSKVLSDTDNHDLFEGGSSFSVDVVKESFVEKDDFPITKTPTLSISDSIIPSSNNVSQTACTLCKEEKPLSFWLEVIIASNFCTFLLVFFFKKRYK